MKNDQNFMTYLLIFVVANIKSERDPSTAVDGQLFQQCNDCIGVGWVNVGTGE